MRLVLIGPVYPFRGGIAHYTTALHRALEARGDSVLMVSFKRQYPDWLFPGKNDRDPSQVHVEVAGAKYWIDSLNPLTWLSSWQRIRQYEPQAIIIQWWTPWWAPAWCVLGLLNRLSQPRPLLFLCHNVLPHERRLWDPLLAKSVLRWGSHYFVQSDEEMQRLLALLPSARVTVIRPPVLQLLPEPRLPKEQVRAQLNLPTGTPVLLFFGIVREYKGLEDLLRALPEVRERLGNVILLVAGEFWEEEASYRSLIHKLGIGEIVRIDNRYVPNEEAHLYFSAADVLVAPYRSVTGSAVVEMALGSGLPVITTNAGGLPQAVQPGSGLLVQPSDSGALASAISRFFEEGLGPAFSANLKALDAGVSFDSMTAKLEELIER